MDRPTPAAEQHPDGDPAASVTRVAGSDGRELLVVSGRLDLRTTGKAWRTATRLLRRSPPVALVDASGVTSADAAGLAFLARVEREAGGGVEGLPAALSEALERFRSTAAPAAPPAEPPGLLEALGSAARTALADGAEQVAFLGAVVRSLATALARPRRDRIGEALSLSHAAGVEGLFIVALINALIGLIIAFIGGAVLEQFGARIFVADAVGIVVVRELGPIMTAILVAGRSGSAYAAELGTMAVNEEIDALKTMGLDPVPLLVVPRVVAGTLMTPLLALYGMGFGVLAGLLEMHATGIPLAVGWDRLIVALGLADLLLGAGKAVVFGFVVTAVGCLRGLQADRGPAAVGQAATRAVVAGIVLVILLDALFAVVTTVVGV